jgi:uncharacterized protein involved in tolerance to divalent cations
MVNIIIYLNKENEARELTDILLEEKLIAKATIDLNNITYKMENGKIITVINSVITAQTKAMLFTAIQQKVLDLYGPEVPMYSIPITQANPGFDGWIRDNTRKV